MVSEGLTQVIWSIYFKWISKNGFYFLYACSLSASIMGVFGYFLPESPTWCYGTERFEECRAMIARIAVWNRKHDYVNKKFEAEFDQLILVDDVDEN